MGVRYQETKPQDMKHQNAFTFAGLFLVIAAIFVAGSAIWADAHVEDAHGWKNERTTVGVVTRLGFTPSRAIENGKFTNYSDDEWFIHVEHDYGTEIWSGGYLGRFVHSLKEGERVSVDHADRYIWTIHPWHGESKREFVMDEVLRITPIMPLEAE